MPLTGTLVVTCVEPGLSVLVDGTATDSALAATGIPVAVGSHRVVLAGPRRRFAAETIEVSEDLRVVLICESPLPPRADEPARERPRVAVAIDGIPAFPTGFSESGAPARDGAAPLTSPLVYALAIGGVAVGGAALGVFLWNRSRYDKWAAEEVQLRQEMDQPGYQPRQVANNRLAASIARATTIDLGIAITSGMLVASSVTLLLSDRAHPPPRTKGKPAGDPHAPAGSLAVDWQGGSSLAFVWSSSW